jgi:hypothetical protein
VRARLRQNESWREYDDAKYEVFERTQAAFNVLAGDLFPYDTYIALERAADSGFAPWANVVARDPALVRLWAMHDPDPATAASASRWHLRDLGGLETVFMSRDFGVPDYATWAPQMDGGLVVRADDPLTGLRCQNDVQALARGIVLSTTAHESGTPFTPAVQSVYDRMVAPGVNSPEDARRHGSRPEVAAIRWSTALAVTVLTAQALGNQGALSVLPFSESRLNVPGYQGVMRTLQNRFGGANPWFQLGMARLDGVLVHGAPGVYAPPVNVPALPLEWVCACERAPRGTRAQHCAHFALPTN